MSIGTIKTEHLAYIDRAVEKVRRSHGKEASIRLELALNNEFLFWIEGGKSPTARDMRLLVRRSIRDFLKSKRNVKLATMPHPEMVEDKKNREAEAAKLALEYMVENDGPSISNLVREVLKEGGDLQGTLRKQGRHKTKKARNLIRALKQKYQSEFETGEIYE